MAHVKKKTVVKAATPAAYLPLARKYRPASLDALIGQPHVTSTLGKAIESGRIGQAYLFAGQRGVGKTSAARILAKALNCAKGPTPSPCQQCVSCEAIVTGTSLDVIEIDGASNRGIEEIRALRETVKFSPTHGTYRIYIIDEVHQITHDAFNALLKTLEEPPAHVKFIFATTVPQKVPPTILSRCQRFDFRRIDAKTIVEALARIAEQEQAPVDEAALYAIARASEGSLRDAEVLLEQLISFAAGRIGEHDVTQLLGAIEHEAVQQLAQALFARDAAATITLLAQQMQQGREPVQVLVSLLTHLRNLLVWRVAGASSAQIAQLIALPQEAMVTLQEQAAKTTQEELLLMSQWLTGAYDLVRRSPFAQTVLELTLIRLATRESWASVAELVERIEQLSQAAPSPAPAAPPRPAVIPPREERPLPVIRGASAAAPTPEPASPSGGESSAVSLEQVTAQWPRIMEQVAAQKMSLAAYLAEAQPIAIEGACVQIGLPPSALHQEVLSAPDYVRLVEQVLSTICGCALRVAYTTLPESLRNTESAIPEPSASVPSSASPLVRDIVQLFNATVMQKPSTS
jgi:DNA polymerase-3 subunit gamma/tau